MQMNLGYELGVCELYFISKCLLGGFQWQLDSSVSFLGATTFKTRHLMRNTDFISGLRAGHGHTACPQLHNHNAWRATHLLSMPHPVISTCQPWISDALWWMACVEQTSRSGALCMDHDRFLNHGGSRFQHRTQGS